ncbi:hypothetical protein [Weissella cibaria]|uniref:hypothetical protein n=1 Tax=Weissella cibaria TaxID=137591 RepID=UPI003D37003A
MGNSHLIRVLFKNFVKSDTSKGMTIYMRNGEHFAVSTLKIDKNDNVVATNEAEAKFVFNVSEVSFVKIFDDVNVTRLLDGPL